MTTEFKNPNQTTKRENPEGAVWPLVSSEGETLRQATGPRNAFKLVFGKNGKESGRE